MVAACETQVVETGEKQLSRDRMRRRMDRFRRAGLFDHVDVTIEQAKTSEELVQAYRLVHDVFVQKQYIVQQPGGLRIREWETLPDMATFVAKAEGRVVAVMSIVPDTAEFGLPSDKAFGAELDSLRAQGRRVCEITNLAVDPSYRNGSIFLELTRVILAHGLTMGYTDGFVSISEEHGSFFQTVLGFEPFGDRRNYGGDTVDYVIGMRLDGTTFEERLKVVDQDMGYGVFLHDWFYTRNPYFEVTDRWHQEAMGEFLKPSTLCDLFVKESSFLPRCDDVVIKGLRRCWGAALLDQVNVLANVVVDPTRLAA